MTQYAIADIGSNTIVLLVYEMVNHYPTPILHISTPTHLIDYVMEIGSCQKKVS